jgi:fluoroacetyl-CoA thioesterase
MPEAFSREGQKTVGTNVDLSHVAATPVGIRVTAQVKLVAVEDRKLRFKVECRDEKEIIGTGFH